MTESEAFDDCQRIEYRMLVTRLADIVGRHQLPIKHDAADINDLLDGDPVHYDLIHEVVRLIYRSGHCSHLGSEVRAETVFNSLGDIRGRLLADRDTDVDQINLLEELGWASRTLFAMPAPDKTPPEESDPEIDSDPVVLQYPAV